MFCKLFVLRNENSVMEMCGFVVTHHQTTVTSTAPCTIRIINLPFFESQVGTYIY